MQAKNAKPEEEQRLPVIQRMQRVQKMRRTQKMPRKLGMPGMQKCKKSVQSL